MIGRPLIFSLCVGLALILGSQAALARWVERPDPMHWHRLADYDVYQDRVRVLYQSMPAKEQARHPQRAINVYLAELYPDGRIENRLLSSGQRRFTALLLQRHGEGVFALAMPEQRGADNVLEFWSARDGSIRATSSPAVLRSGRPNVYPTDDGNLFTVSASTQPAHGDRPTTLTLTRLSPEGRVLATADWRNPTAKAGVVGTFLLPDGGMGVSVSLTRVRETDVLESDIPAIQRFEVGGRVIEASIYSETRLFAFDANGALRWRSPALERMLAWEGEVAIPQDLPPEEILAQNREQMELMSRVSLDNAGERTIAYEKIRRAPMGYGVLASIAADRRLDPPRHGSWYMEIGDDGGLRREVRIEDAAERLDATFEFLQPTDDGGLITAGQHRGAGFHVTGLDPEGRARWTAQLSESGHLQGLAGDASGIWVFGENWSEAGAKNQLWAERVTPEQAERLTHASSAVSEPTAAKPAVSEKPSTPDSEITAADIEFPEMSGGCTCSCGELAQIKAMSDQLESLSQQEQMALLSNASFQAVMMCMGRCAMQYAACR